MNNSTTMPAGCTKLYPWEDRDGEPQRVFVGAIGPVIQTPTGTVTAYIEGTQSPQGVEPRIVVLADGDLSLGQARDFIATLGALVQELEEMEGLA